MSLIASVSGIRGTIGGLSGDGLTPSDITRFTAAYGQWIRSFSPNPKVVVGRDARISGEMVNRIVTGVLMGMGIDVIDLGLATTPTVEIALPMEQAQGGIILTASHNPVQWNALKLLNSKGEFISASEGNLILELARQLDFDFVETFELGKYSNSDSYLDLHIDAILQLPMVDMDAIMNAQFSIGIDAVNSVGAIAVPRLLDKLGVRRSEQIHDTVNGNFERVAEPLNEHLGSLGDLVKEKKLDLGIAVDPDVDRLALVSDEGTPIGEENTLVLAADYVLTKKKGALVANMSSTMALKDIAKKHGVMFKDSPVGEVHVVEVMKKNQAVIGGEGNGGIIYPELHYGRDALVGIALLLSHLATSKKKLSKMVSELPNYLMRKEKIQLSQEVNLEELFSCLKNKNTGTSIDEKDGLKIYYPEGWVHLRKSNTEPIIRLYAEHKTKDGLRAIRNEIFELIKPYK
ncbi:phosphoglucosamine mutase [Flagellimonas pacifica]|uniref:Phosphomannomutase n=1 Tax=Flagellimonas pacifica TaxID=1247520 RepID=A0A285MQQ6_9FLAO|nr:phosphoglucosamine mutase [Allomuricauda parva]SNY99514.1 phosphomannomutase [Allomuricauda parva]